MIKSQRTSLGLKTIPFIFLVTLLACGKSFKPSDGADGLLRAAAGITIEVEIPTIQQAKVAFGTGVALSNLVVTSDSIYISKNQNGFSVQPAGELSAPFGGIFIVLSTSMPQPAKGDLIDVTGTYAENYDRSQINVTTLTKNGTTTLPDPIALSCNKIASSYDGSKDSKGNPNIKYVNTTESYEGVLVTINNVTVTEVLKYGEFIVCGKVLVRLPSTSTLKPAVGDSFDTITGPLDFTFNNYKIQIMDII